MLIRIGYRMDVDFFAPSVVQTILDVHPERAADVIKDEHAVAPAVPVRRFADSFANQSRVIAAPAGLLSLTGEGLVRDSGEYERYDANAPLQPVQSLPPHLLQYLKASRYCEVDELGALAWETFGHLQGAHERVQAVCDYAHGQLKFDYSRADSTRTAKQALAQKTAVCRDFAHTAVTLVRALNIPARYATGYLGDIGVPADPAPMDFSAWFEAYIGGKWYTYDARHNRPRIGRIVVGYGRDAADVAMLTTYGQHTLRKFEVITHEVPSAAQSSAA